MGAPEYLICLNCESPVYVFDWSDGSVSNAQCTVCGSDEDDQFLTDEEFEALSTGGDHRRH